MPDRTVTFTPAPGRAYEIVGSAEDRGVLLSIENHAGAYEEGVSRFLTRAVRPGDVVLDVGANIGVLTVLLTDLAGPTGRVVAFEPAPRNLEYLRRNATGAEIVAAAVGAADGELRFDVNDAYPAGAHVADDGDLVVPCRSIDSWAADVDRLDLIKMDVEGAEPDALHGARRTIERFRPSLVVECNVGALRRVGRASFTDFHRLLTTMFPVVAFVLEDGSTVPVRNLEHLELALGHHGVVDLVGTFERPGTRTKVRAVVHHARLRAEHNRRTPPSDRNFVVSGPFHFEAERIADDRLRVTVRNRSRWWLSSDFTYEPVHLASRSASGEGARARFEKPLGPGRFTTLELDVAPEPVVVTLVQEHYAWLDDLLGDECRLAVT